MTLSPGTAWLLIESDLVLPALRQRKPRYSGVRPAWFRPRSEALAELKLRRRGRASECGLDLGAA
eukprot:12231855-Alexandrium_andersonii.AAC.1